tara:strand:- start:748 stop:1491 length:744 start_codon:yes stop_codon:yes gene_type:complete
LELAKVLEIKSRYSEVQRQIQEACEKADRNWRDVRLMLATKTIPSEYVKIAIDLSHTLFGENKVQELKVKARDLASYPINWHFIGHLQSNKVKECLNVASVIESVDRMSIALEIDRQLQKQGRSVDVFVQVNTSHEQSKFGLEPQDLHAFLRQLSKIETIRVKGLMTLALFSADQDKVRLCFKTLRRLFNEIKNEAIDRIEMSELSMGMSSDFKIAVEEGATLVRVGQAVFGTRSRPDSYYWPEKKA